jgi:hypothetical protein
MRRCHATSSDLRDRDRTFLSRLCRSIRENPSEFELGGKFIDARFSLRMSRKDEEDSIARWSDVFKSPQQRLMDAARWAVQPTSGAVAEELQAICILAWLAFDESAHLVESVLCDLQLIPWKSAIGERDGDPRGAHALWGSREAVALQVFDRRLVEAARRSAAKLDGDA